MISDELKRQALSRGEAIEIDGEVFNAARMKIDLPKKPAALLAPPSKEAASLKAIETLAAATFQMSNHNEQILEVVKQQLAAIPVNKPVREWTFTISHDSKGNLSSIKAIAKE